MRRRQFAQEMTALHGAAKLDGAAISRAVGALHDAEIAAQKHRYDPPPVNEAALAARQAQIAEANRPAPEPPKPVTLADIKAIVAAMLAESVPSRGACPKCGKVIGRGIAIHTKSCKGLSDGE